MNARRFIANSAPRFAAHACRFVRPEPPDAPIIVARLQWFSTAGERRSLSLKKMAAKFGVFRFGFRLQSGKSQT